MANICDGMKERLDCICFGASTHIKGIVVGSLTPPSSAFSVMCLAFL